MLSIWRTRIIDVVLCVALLLLRSTVVALKLVALALAARCEYTAVVLPGSCRRVLADTQRLG
jgi:hypothetical protein